MHASTSIIELLEKWLWEKLHHPVYSPDLGLPNFDLFLKLEERIRRVHFPMLEELRTEMTRQDAEFQSLPRR